MRTLFFIAALVAACAAVSAPDRAQFVFVRIPEALQPSERGAKYEDPLDAALKQAAVGEVTGGGSQLSAPDKEGKRSVEWIGIDVDLTDFDKGLPVLRRELLRLGAPGSTVLEYTRNGEKIEETLEKAYPGDAANREQACD